VTLLLNPPAYGQSARMLADETRDFELLAKGKPAGRASIQITDFDDGTTLAATTINFKVESWFHTYQYDFHGREEWRGNHIERTDNRTTNDGKKQSAHASVEDGRTIIEAGSKGAQAAPKLALTTNYWHLPDMPPGTHNLTILNAETGAIESGWLKRVGPEPIAVEGRKIPCTHFRLIGTVKAELWFDDRGRIAQVQSTENGYPIELRLTRIHDSH